ncbi:hypothetical protein [Rhizobium leucaenae]|uniref:hypothetical protein n=1 Tax=Rhizobium leucaenae TaxID=29450 RepID=UPI00161538E7|nr:hypothetical protein [Rhizobium leucaenae]
MKQRFCRACGGWHALDRWPHNCMPERNLAASDLPAPNYVSDTIEPTQSMVDGQFYTSKAAIRSTYKPSGNKEGKRFEEVGNDASIMRPKPRQKPKPDRLAIKAAVGKAFSQVGLGA